MELLILMLRGVNVGGANRLPMAGFAGLLTGLGFGRVQTYVQSGNAVCLGERDEAEVLVAEALRASFGLSVVVFVRTLREMDAVLAGNPFAAEGALDGAKVHVVFLKGYSALRPGLEAFATRGERFHLGDRAFYLHTPQGFGTSGLAARLPGFLTGDMTARNQRTCTALRDLALGLTGT